MPNPSIEMRFTITTLILLHAMGVLSYYYKMYRWCFTDQINANFIQSYQNFYQIDDDIHRVLSCQKSFIKVNLNQFLQKTLLLEPFLVFVVHVGLDIYYIYWVSSYRQATAAFSKSNVWVSSLLHRWVNRISCWSPHLLFLFLIAIWLVPNWGRLLTLVI